MPLHAPHLSSEGLLGGGGRPWGRLGCRSGGALIGRTCTICGIGPGRPIGAVGVGRPRGSHSAGLHLPLTLCVTAFDSQSLGIHLQVMDKGGPGCGGAGWRLGPRRRGGRTEGVIPPAVPRTGEDLVRLRCCQEASRGLRDRADVRMVPQRPLPERPLDVRRRSCPGGPQTPPLPASNGEG
jgi:hypothetical protein